MILEMIELKILVVFTNKAWQHPHPLSKALVIQNCQKITKLLSSKLDPVKNHKRLST